MVKREENRILDEKRERGRKVLRELGKFEDRYGDERDWETKERGREYQCAGHLHMCTSEFGKRRSMHAVGVLQIVKTHRTMKPRKYIEVGNDLGSGGVWIV
jgi:hypothetical protein